MDYHSDRFEDFSLVVYKKNTLVAVLPANKKENNVHSHQGLTYGGLLLGNKTKLNEIIFIFKAILSFLNEQGIETLHLKLTPSIYHEIPSDEIEYLLFISEATLARVDVSSVIENAYKLKIQSNRMEGVKKAEKNALQIGKLVFKNGDPVS